MFKVLFLLVTALCAAQAGNKTIVEIAQNTPSLSTLVKALTAADLVKKFESPGNFTVFAPTNKAFEGLPAGVLAKLLEPANIVALTKVLNYHVLGSEVHSNQLVDGSKPRTLSKDYVSVHVDGTDVHINIAKVTIADIQASNGVIHVIDAVLSPSTSGGNNTIVDIALNTPSLSTLVQALTAGGLVQTLEGDSSLGPCTVFAPTNAAFEALPAGVLAKLLEPANKAALDKLLFYHLLGSEVHSNQLVDGAKVQTLSKGYISVHVDGKDIHINTAKVVIADVQASNGVIHVIDAVLLPSNAGGNNTIVDIALKTPSLSTLVKAVVAGGLLTTLEGPGSFTVFAPTNAAFEALPPGVLAKLLEPANKAALDKVLLYHVLGSEVHSNQLVDGSKVQTIEKGYVSVHVDGEKIHINTAKVLLADVQASNGVVHVIDAVLSPPNATGTVL